MINNKKQLRLYKFLTTKRYSLKEIGITNKNVLDWSRSGLFLNEKPTKGRRKYNILEYVWIKIIEQLRSFGVSIDSIRKIKDHLMMDTGVKELLISLLEEPEESYNNNAELKEIIELLEFGEEKIYPNELVEYLETDDMLMAQTVMAGLVFGSFTDRIDYHLVIDQKGSSVISFGVPNRKNIAMDYILNSSYLAIPIKSIIADFLTKEELGLFEEKDILQLSFAERQVIEQLRKGNLISLLVKFNQDMEISLIETEENIDIKQAQGKLVDFIIRNNYQEINYKTQDGKITCLRRKTKHKVSAMG
jgi:DNA-binding transcriptional MerR regulator